MSVFIGLVFSLCNLRPLVAFCVVVATVFLVPGDVITLTAPYIVVQADIDILQ
jgi:hypothetical protein